MTEDELIAEFGEDGWYQLEDEVYNRYRFTPMKVEIEEHHVGVYKSKKDNHIKRADHPAYLLRNSLVSASLLAGIWNAKYINAVPLYRQEQEFQRMGVIEQIWLAGRFFVQKDTCRFSMITYTKSYMNIMCFKPMKFRFLFQRNTEQPEQSTTCGFTEQE